MFPIENNNSSIEYNQLAKQNSLCCLKQPNQSESLKQDLFKLNNIFH